MRQGQVVGSWRLGGRSVAVLALTLAACGGRQEQTASGECGDNSSASCPASDGGAATGSGASTGSSPSGVGGQATTTGQAISTGQGGMMAAGGRASQGGSGGRSEGGSGGELASTSGAGEGGAGADGPVNEAYEPRDGSFRALIFSRTQGISPHSAIVSGQQMFEDFSSQYGFEIDITEETDAFTPEGLANYEVVVFLETTGNVLEASEEEAFEAWLTERDGAFVGTGHATDTEFGWDFYKELIGQNYEGHGELEQMGDIRWNDDASDFPAVRGLPSPWPRVQQWFYLTQFETWATKPGFRILGTAELPAFGGVQETVTSAAAFAREYDNFRSFYTVCGHNGGVFDDELVRQHVLGGLLWTVRREHWLD